MIHSVTFPITNKVLISNSFPVEKDDLLLSFIREGRYLKAIKVTRKQVPPNEAFIVCDKKDGTLPVIQRAEGGGGSFDYITAAVRQWQANLAALYVVKVDYRSPTESFTPEDGEYIPVSEIGVASTDRDTGGEDFSLFGRAFLSIPDNSELVEPTHFYRDGVSAMESHEFARAYNYFFLFIESLLGNGKFRENDLVVEFSQSRTMQDAYARAAETVAVPPRFMFQKRGEPELLTVLRNIILLRGELRHHSTKNKRRWSPLGQLKYKDECLFLASICQRILFDRVSDSFFSAENEQEFKRQALKWGIDMNVSITITYLNGDIAVDGTAGKIRLLKDELSPKDAIEIASKVISDLREKSPDLDILSVSGHIEGSGQEVFRYNVGVGIRR